MFAGHATVDAIFLTVFVSFRFLSVIYNRSLQNQRPRNAPRPDDGWGAGSGPRGIIYLKRGISPHFKTGGPVLRRVLCSAGARQNGACACGTALDAHLQRFS